MSCQGKSWEASWKQWPLCGALEHESIWQQGKALGPSRELQGAPPRWAPNLRQRGFHQSLQPHVITLRINLEAELHWMSYAEASVERLLCGDQALGAPPQ